MKNTTFSSDELHERLTRCIQFNHSMRICLCLVLAIALFLFVGLILKEIISSAPSDSPATLLKQIPDAVDSLVFPENSERGDGNSSGPEAKSEPSPQAGVVYLGSQAIIIISIIGLIAIRESKLSVMKTRLKAWLRMWKGASRRPDLSQSPWFAEDGQLQFEILSIQQATTGLKLKRHRIIVSFALSVFPLVSGLVPWIFPLSIDGTAYAVFSSVSVAASFWSWIVMAKGADGESHFLKRARAIGESLGVVALPSITTGVAGIIDATESATEQSKQGDR